MSETTTDVGAESPRRPTEFRERLETLLNETSMEDGSNTPDFLLAGYLAECLRAFDGATAARDRWFGRESAPTCTAACNESHTSDVRCALFDPINEAL